MRILLDVDGVIADFTGAYIEIYKRMGGRVPGTWAWDTWDAMDRLPDQMVAKAVWDHPDLFSVPVLYWGARKQIAHIHDRHDLFFATALPHRHVEARSNWFKSQLPFIHRKNQIVFTPQKYLVKGDVLVEDNTEYLAAWIREYPDSVGILIRHQYNEDRGSLVGLRYLSAANLEEVVGMIEVFSLTGDNFTGKYATI